MKATLHPIPTHQELQVERDAIIAKLTSERPDVAVSVTWESDKHFCWDGDGPDPADDGLVAHDVTVTARTIRAGKMIEGIACLGGCYSEFLGPHCPMIHGYFPQKLEEALQELDNALAKL